MHLRTNGGELSLRLLHAVPSQSPSQPDLHIEVSATSGAFSAREVKAWLEWPDIEAFIADLTTVVREVKGTAAIHAMSSEDFEMTVKSLDALGHFGIIFAIGSGQYMGNARFQCHLRGGIEVEFSQVEALLQWFSSVVSGMEI
ncbi:MAG: hypothetical protein EOP81_09310 [Variovorax sp.]|nr:MAG: hypothetical protein EOP81_09310 [Variovorax sp.]